MPCSHSIGPRPGQEQETRLELMGPNILSRIVQIGLRQGQESYPIVSYSASPVPCTCLSPGLTHCQYAIKDGVRFCVHASFRMNITSSNCSRFFVVDRLINSVEQMHYLSFLSL